MSQSSNDGRRYWRSLERLADSPEMAAEGRLPEHLRPEFAVGADLPPDAITRRTMLGLMGASAALAGGVAGCRPVEAIVPYVNAPEGIVPGVPRHYASTFTLGDQAAGVIVQSHEGRPTKIEGNPRHPGSNGAASAWMQAATLALYDPDRVQAPLHRERAAAEEGEESEANGAAADGEVGHEGDGAHEAAAHTAAVASSWADFAASWSETAARLDEAGDGGRGLAVLAAPHASPTLERMAEELRQRYPQSSWVVWEPAGDENAHAGIESATGSRQRPTYHLDRATTVLSLDADLLLTERDAVRHAGAFAAGRKVDEGGAGSDGMNRLYVAEPTPTTTGGSADHRVRLKPSEIGGFASAVARELGVEGGWDTPLPDGAREKAGLVARDLRAAGSAGLVAVGRRQPPVLHALAHRMNRALGAVGNTVTLDDVPAGAAASTDDLVALLAALRSGEVDTLVVLGANPVYGAPVDLHVGEALDAVPHLVHLTQVADETSEHAEWVLPEAHWLESWGDARDAGGTLSVVQPLIAPLYEGRSAAELLAMMARGEEVAGYDLVQGTWRRAVGESDFDTRWRRTLHTGAYGGVAIADTVDVVDDGTIGGAQPAAPEAPGESEEAAEEAPGASEEAAQAAPRTVEGGLEVAFAVDASTYDGRFANLAWLQEMPDPVTRQVWGNAALVSPATAEAHGVEDGDLVTIEIVDRSVEAPVLVQPGQADDTVTLALGYGRRRAGRVGTGVGVDATRLRIRSNPWFASGATMTATGGHEKVVRTQEYGSMEGRHLVREATVAEYREDPEFVRHYDHEMEVTELWEHPGLDAAHQWGMAIDLTACTGCNACVVACQSENNIPVVGPEQVDKGREMLWLRVDRYYEGEADDPRMVFQPVPCMHCENAPCEQVCPVAATVHDGEGINAMVYNRCIGTRYCSNNCPYKVRRFNYYAFSSGAPEVVQLAANPDVTVRSRGVMEKCTYCIQRINEAKRSAKLDGRRVTDGDFETACQQTCPADAIQFGDLADPESAVSKAKRSPRNYVMLGELHNKPRTSYLARVSNPNPEWPMPAGAGGGHGGGHGDGHGGEAAGESH
ncbi:MAG TPA: TAT-variant-translocated molybdopterin oxidoreductase [Thermoanaerobaculia bacterium]|nr:TAT-variant-translocated molybdopterin oxidoreductase [Thermoanaerobaculia bacterium]